MTLLAFALAFQDSGAPLSPTPATHSGALQEMLRNSGPTALTVLGILLLSSIFSWAIMLSKWRTFSSADSQSRKFVRAFRKSGRLSEIAAVADQFRPSPLVAVFHEIHDEYQRQAGGRGMPPNPQALGAAPP